ncbi:ribonuclease D [Thermaurantiacus sp.]
MHIHPPITQTAALADLVNRLRQADFVCVDTEFIRENSYWPELCLVQVASTAEAAAIDPLAPGLDLRPFLDLLLDENVLKVMHAGSQDLEIFWNLCGKLPSPFFDTQVAAMALGLGEQVSYQHLVAHFTGHGIDKGARFTDWARRPLTERQLLYAIGDVTHLAQIFPKMLDRLRATGRGSWLDEEMARLTDPAAYRIDPDQAWQRLRIPGRKPELLGRLQALARWRELEAMDKNVPRGRIAKDETLLDIAAHPPRVQSELSRVRGLSAAWETNAIGSRLMAALAAAQPLHLEPQAREPRPASAPGSALVADLLKLLLKLRAKDVGVAPRLIARTEELEALAAGVREGLLLLSGWRREIFGEDALALVEGRVGFSIVNGELRMVPAGPPPSATRESPAAAPEDRPAAEAAVKPPRRRKAPPPARQAEA